MAHERAQRASSVRRSAAAGGSEAVLVSYRATADLGAAFYDCVVDLLGAQRLTSVLDVGGGANPVLPIESVDDRNLDYTVLDISASELAKTPAGYATWQADITDPATAATGRRFDLVVTRMLAEHVRDPEGFHRNIFDLTRPGGYAVHLFPTLWALPFVVNRVLPEQLADWTLRAVRPRDRVRHAKFPAFYRWCRGPSTRQLDRLRTVGWEIVDYTGWIGHRYYRRIRPLDQLHRATAALSLRQPRPWMTSYAMVVLRRDERATPP